MHSSGLGKIKVDKELTAEQKKAGFYILRYLTRKKYHISQLKKGNQYRTFVVGNCPVINKSELDKHKVRSGRIALIGLSGMRSVLLACQLGNKDNIPKIIIVDNAEQVVAFWRAIRNFIKENENARRFLENLPDFLLKNQKLYKNIFQCGQVPGVAYPEQNIPWFFHNLFKDYGYDYVRKIIMGTTVLLQSWTDKATFIKLKNILNHHGIENIFMYPSNVIGYATVYSPAPKIDIYKILSNIQHINPKLTIYTDLSPVYRKPVTIFFARDNNPECVKQIIFPGTPPLSLMNRDKKYTEEETVEFIVKNIKFQIQWTQWKKKGLFWRTIYGEKPEYVNQQFQVILKAEAGQITYIQALNEIIKIGQDADKHDHKDRDSVYTRPYYKLFLEENKEEFDRRFRC